MISQLSSRLSHLNIIRTCPSCAYLGFFDGMLPTWINCPQCNKKHCTGCNEIYHQNQTCEQYRQEKERRKDPKHLAHEAMSQACKRSCPHCKLDFMKGDGCNKITCSKCKEYSCYLCGEKIKNYSHFCKCKLAPGISCTCGKCRLFTSTPAMKKLDREKRQEAGRKVLSDAGITDEKQILSILASPPKNVLPSANRKAPPNQPRQPLPAEREPRPAPEQRPVFQVGAVPAEQPRPAGIPRRRHPHNRLAAAANNQRGGRVAGHQAVAAPNALAQRRAPLPRIQMMQQMIGSLVRNVALVFTGVFFLAILIDAYDLNIAYFLGMF